jgi:hypothetical protein
MALANPAGTILWYNGIDFGASTKTLGVRINPVPDASQRTTTFNEYTFQFRTIVAGGPTSAAVRAARIAITKNAGVFIYTGRGLGDIAINTGLVRDVVWGPWTKDVTLQPLAAENAVRILWTLQLRIPECAGAKYRFHPMELAYTVTHEIDRYGYTTWTAAGHLRIPQNYVGNANRLLNDSPDDYREELCPPLTHGFRRTYGPWVVSEDRTRLDFEIRDEEMGSNFPPPGIVDVKASHDAGSQMFPFTRWTETLNAEYELAKSTAPAVAVDHFFGTLVKDRVLAGRTALLRQQNGAAAVLPLAIHIGEPDIYGKVLKVRCTFGWSWVWDWEGPVNPLAASGLWRPVPHSNWIAWSQSLTGTALHPRGNSRFVMKVVDEDVIDLCHTPRAIDRYVPGKTPRPLVRAVPPARLPDLDANFPVPVKRKSWLHYEAEVRVEADSGTAPVRTLPTETEYHDLTGQPGRRPSLTDFVRAQAERLDASKLSSLANTAGSFATGASFGFVGATNIIDLTTNFGQRTAERLAFQVTTRPLVYVSLRVFAARWGYPVPCPSLSEVNGLTPVLACRLDRGEGFVQGTVACASGSPIHVMRANLRYALPDVPQGMIPVPPNPLHGG